MSMTIIVGTESYPYDLAKEHTFLEHEIAILAKTFDHVILLPETIGGTRHPYADGVQVEEGYARALKEIGRGRTVFRAAAAPGLLLADLLNRFSAVSTRSGAKRLVQCAGRAHLANDWLATFLEQRGIRPAQCVVYTFWWGSMTTGFALSKRQHPSLTVVTRAHNYDVYEERYDPPYLPCRRAALQFLDGIFPCSEGATQYLRGRYGKVARAIETARLGVRDPDGISRSSTDGVFRLVSCSFIVPVKRPALIVEGLAHAGRLRAHQRFEWTHFGDGPLRDEVVAKARDALPANVVTQFLGYIPQQEVLRYYIDNPVDLFVNVSSYEGTPVSVMEAASVGIPIVATAVGGNAEIVTTDNGKLVSANPSAADLGEAFLYCVDHPELMSKWRQGSRAVWSRSYDADANFTRFARHLLSLAERNGPT